ncbi:hypothetical protein ElyMa_001579700 [Elysia marginata]|uniref:Major facilitator superfamily associated domain-containing protein n=1 Tax=Elysia marginata TaxID=1093978 RepID=A0AAV4JDA0_9GAST|nr:hypothetical protein ElyMa_001579700 [Elysia marginata]
MSQLLWQLALTAEAFGLDACIALELILMVTNTQTLGVPIRYAAAGGSLSAFCGFLFIPILGVASDRWAKTKTSKAKILVVTTCIELIGLLCVFVANALKLYSNENSSDYRTYDQTIIQEPSSLRPYEIQLLASAENFTVLSNNLKNSFSENTGHTNTVFGAEWNNSKTSLNTPLYDNSTANFSAFLHPNMTLSHGPTDETHSVPFYAYIAILGYCCLDAGYDFGSCFLKTFVLQCTHSEQHVHVLLNLILIASVGGVLTSVLGSLDVGAALTAGTDYDSNAALTMVISAMCAALILLGTTVTLTTGFCFKPPSTTLLNYFHHLRVSRTDESSCGTGIQGVEHVLQHCPHSQTLRAEAWPTQLSLQQKLSGNLQYLQTTADFIDTTDTNV